MSSRNQLRRRWRPILITVGPVAVVALAVGLWAFQPWKVFTHSTVDEALPAQPAQPAVLAQGSFVSQEHETSGFAKVVQLADGSRYLRLENFATSDGPDVHVLLTDQPASADWKSYDRGRYIPLGKLKATNGNQNYPIPPDAELAGMRSVSIWCDRFNVSFGSAPLSP